MIGGADIVIPTVGDPAALEACARIVRRHWPEARFEDADTGEKYATIAFIPLGDVRGLFAYSDLGAEAAWDADSPEAPANSMLYLIRSPDSITIVLDDPSTSQMRAMIESIRDLMHDRVLFPNRAASCAEAA